MTNNPLISVIIPVFNAELYLHQCIECILCQTYNNLEIIVVDDGSNDNTKQIVKNFSMVKYFHQEHAGISSARNIGIMNATGDYIHFMDVDDLISLDFYENMVDRAIATQSELACCGFEFERYPSQSIHYNYSTVASYKEDKIDITNVLFYGACWRYLIKASLFKKNSLSFDEELIVAEDRLFSLKAVLIANKIVTVPKATYIYKNRAKSITTIKDTSKRLARKKARRKSKNSIISLANEYNIDICMHKYSSRWCVRLFGIPIVSKKISRRGKIVWSVLGVPVLQKKEVDK